MSSPPVIFEELDQLSARLDATLAKRAGKSAATPVTPAPAVTEVVPEAPETSTPAEVDPEAEYWAAKERGDNEAVKRWRDYGAKQPAPVVTPQTQPPSPEPEAPQVLTQVYAITEMAQRLKDLGGAFVDGLWFIRRCGECGEYGKEKCCGKVSDVAATRLDGTLTGNGQRALGLLPILKPNHTQTPKEQVWVQESWWKSFRGLAELERGGTKFYIENFLPEGIVLLCGLPKEGKSQMCVSIAKALTSGKPLFGKSGFEVNEIVPVLYLAAEGKDGQLESRCRKYGITENKTRFISRTLSQGRMFGLAHPHLEALVKAMKPIVILETLIRFNDGDDESNAAESKKFADAIFHLIGLSASTCNGWEEGL